ncbi:MAG TPA: hypothetical protein DCO65_05310 [Spartobacteria bacterium]|nr:hypothetical protein [Spartobacteria bacterium]
MRQKSVYLACFVLHFLLKISISCRETLWLVARGLTIFPSSLNSYSRKAETVAAAVLGQHLPASNPLRQALATYLHIAGIETGYGYFAPNVPGSYKLVFELHYPDGHLEYELPRVSSAAAGLRVAGLLDKMGGSRYDPLRETMVKMLAYSVWQEHPAATAISAVFGTIKMPTIAEFERGEKESYEFLYSYDFSRTDKATEPKNP